MVKRKAVAWADTDSRAIRKVLALSLTVGGKGKARLKDAFRVVCVVMHDVTLVRVLRTQWD